MRRVRILSFFILFCSSLGAFIPEGAWIIEQIVEKKCVPSSFKVKNFPSIFSVGERKFFARVRLQNSHILVHSQRAIGQSEVSLKDPIKDFQLTNLGAFSQLLECGSKSEEKRKEAIKSYFSLRGIDFKQVEIVFYDGRPAYRIGDASDKHAPYVIIRFESFRILEEGFKNQRTVFKNWSTVDNEQTRIPLDISIHRSNVHHNLVLGHESIP